jgi:hypothetical protein
MNPDPPVIKTRKMYSPGQNKTRNAATVYQKKQ